MNRLYILCGIPFSGKTTLAKELEKKLGFQRIDLDDTKFEVLGAGIRDGLVRQNQWDKIYQEMYLRIEGDLKAGKNVVNDTGNFTKYERNLLRIIAEKVGVESKVIFVYVPVVTAKKRWLENKESNLRFDISEKSFNAAVNELEIPKDDENTIVYDGSIPVDLWLNQVEL